jgi:LuxR family maltose regulon positive regulatory protein
MRFSDSAANYAKLSVPQLHGALPRRHLFSKLDSLRHSHAVTWVIGIPGAGKTTLAATYLADVKLPSIWYQIDSTDADPAAFFYFLAQSLGSTGATLPWLAVELAEDLPRFARIFFRDFYKRLPSNTVVVFDNCQELDWSTHGELIEIAFSELPEGINVLALSRDAPPSRLAHLELGGRIAILSRESLRMDTAEARALGQFGQDAVEADDDMDWLTQVDGWAAGIVMLRSHLAKTPGKAAIPKLDGRDAIFRYFAGVILERMPHASQIQLLMLSCLPSLSEADATHLTGDESAGRLLKRLYRGGLFIDRRGTKTPIYRFHSLFQEFLAQEAIRRLEPDMRSTLIEQAAMIIDGQGRTEEAARLYRDAKAFDSLSSLLIRTAKQMRATGRSLTWCEWLSWLPAETLRNHPQLWYWHGVFQNPINPVLAKKSLLLANDAFQASGSAREQVLTVAAIVDNYLAYYGSGDFQSLGDWIVVMRDAMLRVDRTDLDPEADLQISSRLTAALFLSSPESPELQASVQRTIDLMPQVTDHSAQLTAGGILLFCMHWINADVVSRVVALVSNHVENSSINPITRIWCCIRAARWNFDLNGDPQSARTFMDIALKLAIDFGPNQMISHLRYMNCLLLLGTDDQASAHEALQDLRASLPSATKIDRIRLACLEAVYFLQTGNNNKCLEAAQDMLDLSIEAATAWAEHSRYERIMANCHAQMGNFSVAYEWLEKAIEHTHGTDRALAAQNLAFVRAYATISEGDPEQGTALLSQAFATHRQQKSQGFFVRFPQLASRFASLALDSGIEVEHVRGIIKRQQLKAPDQFTANWPRPIEVRVFGKMEVLFDGQTATAKGKSQLRLLKLLKLLLIAGKSGKTQSSLIGSLWPEAEDGRSALSVAIHRLRKLLKCDEAIVVSGGRISVNMELIASDLFAFDSFCDRVDNLPADSPVNKVVQFSNELLGIYRGSLCDGEEDTWLLPARERTHQRFLALVTGLGMCLEAKQQWTQARDLYLRALSTEPLSEVIYRSLMRCAHAQNDPSAAFSAYRRCRDTLSILLGRKPSEETDKLAMSLGLLSSR